MKITWLGQAGLLFETNEKTIVVDPYLSDSVEKIEPQNKRRVPVEKKFLELKPNIIILTHNHLDHTDPETLKHYIKENSNILLLAPKEAWQNIRRLFCGIGNNFVLFNAGTIWTEKDIKFTAVKAEHSDESAIGIIIEAENKKYYLTGDTLYNEKIFKELPEDIDYVFLPVNGKGNNMNMADAKTFCERINATAIPLHCGLFDSIDMNDFEYKNKIIPEFYKEIKL